MFLLNFSHTSPYLGQIERVELPLLCLIIGHDLDVHGPRREVAVLDRIVEIALRIIGVGALETTGLFAVEVLDALVSLIRRETRIYNDIVLSFFVS